MAWFLCVTACWAADEVDLGAVHRIRQEAFGKSRVMEHAFFLTDVHGPRLTGSPQLRAAAEWVADQARQWGLANVALEPWGTFGEGWSAQRFVAHIREPQQQPLIGYARPWSPGTPGPVSGTPILAPISGEDDFPRFQGKLKGRIVLISKPRTLVPMTRAPAVVLSGQQLDEIASDNPKLNVVPNNVFGLPDPPKPLDREIARARRNRLHQFLQDEGVALVLAPGDTTDGGTVRGSGPHLQDGDVMSPPWVLLTPEHYNRIVRLIERRRNVSVEFDIGNQFHEAEEAFNVVAEIPGTDLKDEIVMLGAHLDSWTGGTGATDNAAGSSVVIEAMRLLQTLNLKPRRTVRMALWTGEEQGLLGSKAYVKKHFADPETMELKPAHSKLAGYFNLDNGSGKIRGVYLQGNDSMRPVFERWLAPFRDLGARAVTRRNTSGTDHLSFNAVGLPGFQFVQDPLEYGTRTHHTNMDVYDRLQTEHLQQASAIMASFAYFAATREEKLPRKPLPEPKPEPGLKPDIPFVTEGALTLTLDAYVPAGDGPFPAAIIVHGGGFTRGDKQTFVKPLFEPLAAGGVAWFSINYRLAPAHRYPAPVDDVISAVKWVRTNAARFNVDPEKVVLIGESAGGHLVSMVGTRKLPVKGVVAFYAPHDLAHLTQKRGAVSEGLSGLLGVKDLSPASMKALAAASPIAAIHRDLPPYLLLHGTRDEQVPHEQSERMCEAIAKAGGACDLSLVEGAAHGVGGWDRTPGFREYRKVMLEWIERAVR
ncbi:MAG: M20/M25/M40 family metallo-hydrolase [Bryobacterales bacterium]|nr:M20/M25/M40 family metallo-hydrolase [Bryobacterales bacterium]